MVLTEEDENGLLNRRNNGKGKKVFRTEKILIFEQNKATGPFNRCLYTRMQAFIQFCQTLCVGNQIVAGLRTKKTNFSFRRQKNSTGHMNVALGQARPTGCKFAGNETPTYIKLGENGAHTVVWLRILCA